MSDASTKYDLNRWVDHANEDDKPLTHITISDYFSYKNIFITGGTGFLGAVLIEALLDATPYIGTIYVLVRGKKNVDPNERIKRLLQKQIFEKYDEHMLEKVVPVVGELSDINFSFSETILTELTEKVHIIYHCAATIKFSSPLRTAIRTNVIGTMRTIELAKRVKNLSAYIYLSTAFCNSNRRGLIHERVYQSRFDPYEMMRMADDDTAWIDFTKEKCKEIINDHPNTYTFTKNLAENLLQAEMKGMPATIVRPSIVYGTWEKPLPGWVGAANSGHLGFLAGFIKGAFRTLIGSPSAVIDLIPCDYVINSSLVMGWYVGTRPIEQPEVIHCSSGELNPLTNEEFVNHINASVERHPPDTFVWKPVVKLRNGWRYTLNFYIFHLLTAAFMTIPEKLFQIGMRQHTIFEYMQLFQKGMKAFTFFMDTNFHYDTTNALRIMKIMNEKDRIRYNFDASHCDWSEFLNRVIIGIRRFYFKEAAVTTSWHRNYWKFSNFIYYAGFLFTLMIIMLIAIYLFGYKIGAILAISLWSFLVWL